MVAEILFRDPADVDPVSAPLALLDFRIEIIDRVDENTNGVWITATTLSDLYQDEFLDHMRALVGPIGGDVAKAGLAEQ